MPAKIDVPLSKAEVAKTSDWLKKHKDMMPESIYNNILISLKCCEALEHMKVKFKDMISLLAQQMGIISKSEKGTFSKHRWGTFSKTY